MRKLFELRSNINVGILPSSSRGNSFFSFLVRVFKLIPDLNVQYGKNPSFQCSGSISKKKSFQYQYMDPFNSNCRTYAPQPGSFLHSMPRYSRRKSPRLNLLSANTPRLYSTRDMIYLKLYKGKQQCVINLFNMHHHLLHCPQL